MNVLTWNILADEFVYDYNIDPVLLKRNVRYKKIIRRLHKYNADVMLLQEVMEDDSLSSFLKTHHIVRSKPLIWQGIQSRSGNVIILRKSFLIHDIIYLDFGVGVYVSYKNKLILILNIHLDDVSSQLRIKQVKSFHLPYENIIIGGDFNDTNIFNLFHGYTIWNHKTTYVEDDSCIDNIITKGFDCDSCHVDNVKNMNTLFKMYGSDHLPVFIKNLK